VGAVEATLLISFSTVPDSCSRSTSCKSNTFAFAAYLYLARQYVYCSARRDLPSSLAMVSK
jgi:hypothetical protein